GIAGIGAIVAGDDLDLLAEKAALGVDLLDRKLPSLLVGVEEGRHRLVAVQLADLDRLLRRSCAGIERAGRNRTHDMNHMTPRGHDQLLLVANGMNGGPCWPREWPRRTCLRTRAECRIDSAISETGAAPASGALQLATPGH